MLSVWSALTETQHNYILLAIPVVLFALDFITKSGHGISSDTSGPDLALVGIGIDASALVLSVTDANLAAKDRAYLLLLIVMLLAHFAMWAAALWCVAHAGKNAFSWVAFSRTISMRGPLILSSYFLGFGTVYLSLIAVLQRVLTG